MKSSLSYFMRLKLNEIRNFKMVIILPLTFCFGIDLAFCQLLSNKNQTVYIGTEVVLTVEGSVLNEGTIENDGEIIVTGDWDNNQQYLAGNGTLILAGENQQINHNGSDVYELVIDGTGEMKFISDLNISGRLYLDNGFVTPVPGIKIMAKSGAIISEGHEHSFINGAFFHQGAGEKLYPIGKSGNYNPVELFVQGNPILGYEVFGPNPSPYFSFELRDVSRIKYWEQTLFSGEVEDGSLITLPLEWQNGEELALEEVVVAGADAQANYSPLVTYDRTGFINSGFITSELKANLKYIALGLTAERPEERAIYIPNAFAPGIAVAQENGEDNRIKVYGKEISSEDFLFRIFNRWGAIVYETTSYEEASTKGWDGINQKTGRLESIGSFKFMLKGKYNSGRTIEKSGSIHLIQ